MQRVDNLEDIVRRNPRHIDVYVSTDSEEIGGYSSEYPGLLERLGYTDISCYSPYNDGEESLHKAYENADIWISGSSSCRSPTNIRIDSIDTPIEEAFRQQREIGFIPQSRFRVYCNGNSATERELVTITKALKEMRQNIAIMDADYTRLYVELSEFYIPERPVN